MAKELDIVQKTFIEAKHQELTVKEIAEHLNLHQKTVKAYVDKIKVVAPDTVEVKSGLSQFEQLLPQEAKKIGAIVLTQAAAEFADENKQPSRINPEYQRCIRPARK